MNQSRSSGGDGRDALIEDPAEIRQVLAQLHRDELEFPIKVEGAQTLPYTSHIRHVDLAKGLFHLKLIRPLPHEMALGAPFEMLFSVGEQRFEAPITFLGRESYLLYRFSIPVHLLPSDRRRQKRYPFRPREQAYVLAQDGAVPGHGLAGPLVNLSIGGLAFRVDRLIRMDDQMRITPGLGFFEKGKVLPMLKIRDLPKFPLFEARGMVANARERGGEIVVGVKFADLGAAELRMIQDVLNLRDQMLRTPANASVSAASVGAAKVRGSAQAASPAQRSNPSGSLTPEALTLLGRRCTRVVLAMTPGPDRSWLLDALAGAGYLRLEPTDTLEQALDRLRADDGATIHMLLVESPLGAQLRLTDIRTFQRELGELRELPVALVQAHGLPPETEDPLIRPLPWPEPDSPSWLPLLDELAGL
jgi:hypothetical protein